MAEKTLVLDSQDLRAICEYFGIDYDGTGITGALVEIADGEYCSCELTTDNKPYLIDAVYRDVGWFKE